MKPIKITHTSPGSFKQHLQANKTKKKGAVPTERTEEEMSSPIIMHWISVSNLWSLSTVSIYIPCKYCIKLTGCKITNFNSVVLNWAQNENRVTTSYTSSSENYSALCWWPVASHAVTALPLMTVFPDKGQHVVFGEFLRIHAALRVMNSDPFLPGPKQPFMMTHPEERERRKRNKQNF